MYIFIGIRHFTDPQYFIDIVPPQLPFKLFLVYFTGLIEVVGGVAILAPKTRKAGAYLLANCFSNPRYMNGARKSSNK